MDDTTSIAPEPATTGSAPASGRCITPGRLLPLLVLLLAAAAGPVHGAGSFAPEAACGDGVAEMRVWEQCDDGNGAGGDGCDGACLYETVGQTCGDGQTAGLEVCDDGNVTNGDACNPTCNFNNATTPFAGAPGIPGFADGAGAAARFSAATSYLVADGPYLWMADTGNHAIRRITIATAEVLTVAGNGTAGYVDDPGGANARFSAPSGIATDGVTLWIADSGNRVLRAMSTSPPYPVTTVAGSPGQPYADGIGPDAGFDAPRGPLFAGGYVYLLDATAATLRRFDPATREVTTLAGSPFQTGTTDGFGPQARFVSPRYLAAGDPGTLFIADTNGAKIRAYDIATTEVRTLAGDGSVGYVDGVGAEVRVHRPRGLTFDGTSLYWVEAGQHTVRQLVLSDGRTSTLAGSHCDGNPCTGGYLEGVGSGARFNTPADVLFHFPSRSLFLFDATNTLLRRIR